MEITKTVYFTDRNEWRKWLEENFLTEREIWLVYPKKETGMPKISYNDAVEEALCFEWIDSTHKTLDEEHTAQRFTPRNPKSGYSQPNIERLRWLAERNMIHPLYIPKLTEIIKREFIFPEDIIDEIKKIPEAWVKYQNFPEAYKRLRIAYIHEARRRPEEFQRRLQNFIEKTKVGKMIGFGGIEKYY